MELAPLTPSDAGRLATFEDEIERASQSFFKVAGPALAAIRDERLYRADFDTFEDYCQERWGFTRQRASQLIQAAVVSTVVDIANEAQARELAPVLRDEGEQAVANLWGELRSEYGDDMPTALVLKNAVTKRVARIRRERATAALRAKRVEPSTPSDIEIRHGDLRSVLDDLRGTVDAIITDPPYPSEFIEKFDALGALALQLLAPSGVLVVMVGQSHLPDYVERLSRHLLYRWCGAYLTSGPATRIHGRQFGTQWKPILVFDRGGDRSYVTRDVYRGDGDDKRFHHWGQSAVGFAQLVEQFTKPGALVCDPFLGGGTTAVVCRDLGRRFVGCDVDAAAVHTERVA